MDSNLHTLKVGKPSGARTKVSRKREKKTLRSMNHRREVGTYIDLAKKLDITTPYAIEY